jgi:hypothetical protein
MSDFREQDALYLIKMYGGLHGGVREDVHEKKVIGKIEKVFTIYQDKSCYDSKRGQDTN